MSDHPSQAIIDLAKTGVGSFFGQGDPEDDAAPRVGKRESKRGSASSVSTTYAPDSRCCVLCSVRKANSPDPVNPDELMAWYYKPRNGKTQGSVDYYCGRAWYSRYRSKYPQLGDFVTECGKTFELGQELVQAAAWFLEQCIKAGSRLISVRFSDVPESVTSTQRQGIVVEDEDQHVELNHYVNEWRGGQGDPRTNGTGHRVGWCDGVWGVFVPGPPVKMIKRQRAQFVDQSKIHDDGSLQLTETQMQDTAANIMAGFAVVRSLGLKERRTLHAEAIQGRRRGRLSQGGGRSWSAPGDTCSTISALLQRKKIEDRASHV